MNSGLSASSWRITSSALIFRSHFRFRRSTWPGAARSDRRIFARSPSVGNAGAMSKEATLAGEDCQADCAMQRVNPS